MANILYNRCLIRFNEFSEFDSTTALLAIDAFYNITQLMFVKSQDVVAFVNAISKFKSFRMFFVVIINVI